MRYIVRFTPPARFLLLPVSVVDLGLWVVSSWSVSLIVFLQPPERWPHSAGQICVCKLQESAGVVARSKNGTRSLSPLPPGAYSPKPIAEVLLTVVSPVLFALVTMVGGTVWC